MDRVEGTRLAEVWGIEDVSEETEAEGEAEADRDAEAEAAALSEAVPGSEDPDEALAELLDEEESVVEAEVESDETEEDEPVADEPEVADVPV
jgi:hypothetical protein